MKKAIFAVIMGLLLTGCGVGTVAESEAAETTAAETTVTVTETTTGATQAETTASPETTVAAETTTTAETTMETTAIVVYQLRPTESVVEEIGKSVEITDKIIMAAEMIGAIDGTSFMYNGNKFEVYQFKAGDMIFADAADGTASIDVQGIGAYEMSSAVNGDYVMLYITPDDAVIDAFKAVSMP